MGPRVVDARSWRLEISSQPVFRDRIGAYITWHNVVEDLFHALGEMAGLALSIKRSSGRDGDDGGHKGDWGRPHHDGLAERE